MITQRSLIPALAALLVSACASSSQAESAAPAEAVAEPAPVNLLTLTLSAKAAGASPRILLCRKGADLALGDPPAAATAAFEPSGLAPQDLLKRLIADGVQSDVCAIYLPNRPFGLEALIDGVSVANPADVGRLIAAPDLRLFSF
ncbi:MAG: hypothetical protein FP825_16685 [Hyphomonas sp.]|uniref:hypothetical protein n=1 Tax=Hyphomonas sp. TaxID=87 RepID=UPI0017C1F919|nr:hypothetical protein [Hyphomonas sp.]MBA3070107.1 hypothetical protein [Hyphomonas sp.]MBU3921730.1 hypothetical protein [Alphaproteobacteria bacterium]MBU4060317.1 hypothetical protein [Alphaproteobacteria bacterium]MBU4162985.1 hypothetical protein [Alphaproteobacteria bacterium]